MLWLPLLVGLQGVPHTGGLRTLFLLIGLGHLAWLKRTSREQSPELGGHAERIIFWLLLTWLMTQSVLVAAAPMAALQALSEDWGKLVLMMFVGIWASRLAPEGRWLAWSFFLGAFLHVLSTLGAQALSVIHGEGLAFQQSLLSEYPLAATFSTMSLAWLMTDGVAYVLRVRRVFPWPIGISAILLGLTFFAEMVLKAKSGQVMTIVLIVIVAMTLLVRSALDRRKRLLIMVACATAFGLVAGFGHDRWMEMRESIGAAQNGPLPVQALVTDNIDIPQGTDHSFYMRALRVKVALDGVSEYPWGLGYSTDVYHRYVKSRYGIENAIQSSNSGLMDFALATGLPGAFMLLLMASVLAWRGWQAFNAGRTEGLVLLLLVVNQMGVYTLDGTLGGSRFNGFALIAGALWAVSAMNGDKQR